VRKRQETGRDKERKTERKRDGGTEGGERERERERGKWGEAGVEKEKESARAINRDMSVSQTSWHKEVIIGRNSVFRVFLL
jgi:hypothetical protein